MLNVKYIFCYYVFLQSFSLGVHIGTTTDSKNGNGTKDKEIITPEEVGIEVRRPATIKGLKKTSKVNTVNVVHYKNLSFANGIITINGAEVSPDDVPDNLKPLLHMFGNRGGISINNGNVKMDGNGIHIGQGGGSKLVTVNGHGVHIGEGGGSNEVIVSGSGVHVGHGSNAVHIDGNGVTIGPGGDSTEIALGVGAGGIGLVAGLGAGLVGLIVGLGAGLTGLTVGLVAGGLALVVGLGAALVGLAGEILAVQFD